MWTGGKASSNLPVYIIRFARTERLELIKTSKHHNHYHYHGHPRCLDTELRVALLPLISDG